MQTETSYANLPAFICLLLITMIVGTVTASAVEVGEPAPNFKLQSTTGKEISLRQFKDKRHVLIQFYTMDFNPT